MPDDIEYDLFILSQSICEILRYSPSVIKENKDEIAKRIKELEDLIDD